MSLNRALELPLSESLTGHFNEQQSKNAKLLFWLTEYVSPDRLYTVFIV